MIVQPADFGKPRSLSPEFASLLSLCWRNGAYGNFWYASVLRYSEEEANLINQTQKRKNKVRAGDNKVTLTTWHPCNQPLPSVLPPQWFRSPFYGLSYRLLKNRFVTPDDPAFLHAYFGVNPVSPKPSHLRSWQYGVRSRKNTIQAVNVFIGDLDVKDFGGDWQALRHYIENDLLLPPTAIIFTGGGVQIYFGLRETFPVFENGKQSKKLLEQIDGLYKGWNDYHEKFDPGAKDLSRAFRCENTINGKEKYGPVFPTTRFSLLDLSRLYSLHDFDKLLPVNVVMPKVVPRRTKSKSATKSTAKASQPSPWQPPIIEYVPDSAYTSQQGKIEFYLQYFNHHDYHDWWFVGMVFLGEMGETDGYERWTEWSRKSHKFDEARQKSEWKGIQEKRKERIGGGETVASLRTLIGRARERGAPTERVGGEWQPVQKPKLRVYLGELRVCVAETLANLFVPDGKSWALLNPAGADTPLYEPRQKPLKGAILDHIGGGTRRALFDGKRKQTKVCVTILPSEMTRVMAIRATSASHALDVQKQLASQGLTSFSYSLCSVFPFFSSSPNRCAEKVAPNGQIAIPYIYKADGFSKNDNLGKMANQGLGATFPNHQSDETEIEHIVLVAFSECVPSQLLHTHTRHTQLDPYVLPYQLLSHYPPFCPAESSKISLVTVTGEETFEIGRADVGFKAWDTLLKRDIINDTALLAGLQVDKLEIQPVRAKNHEIGQSVESVARWHNRRHVMLKTQTCECGQALAHFDTGDGYAAGWCPSCGGQPVTNFHQTARALNLTLDELVTQVTETYQLGQAGAYIIEHEPQAEQVDIDSLIATHTDKLARTREQLSNDVNQGVIDGSLQGKITIIDATAGLGKSTIVRELIPKWLREHQLFTRVTTDTKNLSWKWHHGWKPFLISSFVFESLLDCCECYSLEIKVKAVTAGYRLKHNKDCAFVAQINEMLRGSDKKAKKIAILRHEHLRMKVRGRRLVAGADVYVSDEDLAKALIESDSVDLFSVVKATLARMENKDCTRTEMALLAALFSVCRERRLSKYQHLDGSVIVEMMKEELAAQNLTLSSCLEAIRCTSFAHEPRLSKSEVENNEELDLPKIWLPKFLVALEQTIKNPVHPSFFLVQASKDKRYSKLEIESWIKHQYLPEYNLPLVQAETSHIILDATPNKLIYQALMPDWEIDFLSYHLPPAPQHRIIQIDGINLTRKYLKENLRVAVSKVAAILNDMGLFVDGIVTRKSIRESLRLHLGVDADKTLNFRNQRGSNDLSGAEVLLVFGDATVPTNAACRFAHALWSHDPRPFETHPNGSLFAKEGGRWQAFDERLQAVLNQVRDEGIQSSHRQRLINGDFPKTLIIVSNYDATELVGCLDASRVTVIDAKRLHGNSKQVREALDVYHDRLISACRVANTGG